MLRKVVVLVTLGILTALLVVLTAGPALAADVLPPILDSPLSIRDGA